MRYRAYIFDLDGTLLDTSPGVFAAFRGALARLGRPEPTDEILAGTIGPTLKSSFVNLFGVPEEAAEDAVRIYREEYAAGAMFHAERYDGMAELLQILKEKGCALGVASYKLESYIEPVLERFDLAAYFDVFCGVRDEWESKAQIIGRCLSGLSCPPQQAVMIGDSPYDAIGAKEAGIAFIGAGYGFGFRQNELPYPAPMADMPLDILNYC